MIGLFVIAGMYLVLGVWLYSEFKKVAKGD